MSDGTTHYAGCIQAGPKHYECALQEVSAWTKKDKNGNPWQSLSFQVKGDRQESPPSEAPKPTGSMGDMDDDIPF